LHHANTNHIVDGETHVPPLSDKKVEKIREKEVVQIGETSEIKEVEKEVVVQESSRIGKTILQKVFGRTVGEFIFGWFQLGLHLIIGWPAYILFGATGGPSRGITNHFLPLQIRRPFSGYTDQLKELFPTSAMKAKVWVSNSFFLF
jgi:omega-6 fatty acid desaturase (delta-12 desaturase)